MIEYHLSRLNDKSAQVRLQSIKELELLGATEVLDALRTVYESDPDPEVRKAAKAAGKVLYEKSRQEKKSN
jgi:hypothetical protein